MDQILRPVLHFDRFALDLTRGYLRIDDRDIELPPKPFEVLRCLAENAGCLVTKDELCSAVWPDVTVGDDSLVQCIRLLRQKLGDHDHNLIKTIPRRGYLLDATVTTSLPPPGAANMTRMEPPDVPGGRPGSAAALNRIQHTIWAKPQAALAAVLLFCAVVPAAYLLWMFVHSTQERTGLAAAALLPRQPPPASDLFSTIDAQRVADLAASKQLPLPSFVIHRPAAGVPDSYRRFSGIWVSDAGWPVSGRQLMLIVTNVDAAGVAEGYVVDGPPQPKSRDQDAARFNPFIARISGDAFYFGSVTGERMASLMPDRQIEFRRTWRDGGASSVILDPAWTLLERERKVPMEARGRP